jgi:hypothetical protein
MTRKETLLLIGIILLALVMRVWRLETIPPVINGDEAGSIIHPLQILMGKSGSIFNLTHDYSVSYIVFLPKAFFMFLLGEAKALFAARLTTALFSVAALIPFYFLLRRQKLNIAICLMTTLAFACSYWYLNFSRLSWINVDSIFFGLCLLLFIERAVEKGKLIDFVTSGVFAGLVLYNYMGGRIYFLASLIILFLWLIINVEKNISEKFRRISVYFLVAALIFFPQIPVIISNFDQYIIRPRTIAVFNQQTAYYGYEPGDKFKVFLHQVDFAIRGFVFFDPAVSSEGVENMRYIPQGRAAVNNIIVVLFLAGLFISFLKKKGSFSWWIIYGLNILLLQIPSALTPGWGRALGVCPIIYLFAALTLEEIWKSLNKRMKYIATVGIMSLVLFSSFMDISTYWQWVNGEQFRSAQRPAIELGESEAWENAQIDWIKNGKFPFTFYDWQNADWRRNNLLSTRSS